MTLQAATSKACSVCGQHFAPFTSTQQVCGLKCARRVPIIARNTLKAERKVTKAKLDAIKPRGKWMAEAQTAFNAYVRLRDAAQPCVSCGRMHDGQWHAGHYLTTGARPELRFDEDNVHKQCQPCNTHLHGNLVLYRLELIRRRGLSVVERLEGPHEPRKWTIDELKVIRDTYRQKAKQLSRDAERRGTLEET